MKKVGTIAAVVLAVYALSGCAGPSSTAANSIAPQTTETPSGTTTTQVQVAPESKAGTVTYKVTTEGADIFYTASPEEPPARDISGAWEKSTSQGNQIGFVLNVQGKTAATNSSCEILLDGKTLSKKNGTGKVMCDAARP